MVSSNGGTHASEAKSDSVLLNWIGGTPNTQCRDKPRNKTVPLLSKNLTFSISEGPAPRSTWAIGVPTPNQAGQGGALKRFVLRNADVWISYIYIA